MAKQDNRPIAVVGTGQSGISALINTIVDLGYKTPDGAPATTVVVIDTKDEAKPRSNALYPMNGMKVDDMHPFSSAKPPAGFPTFGEYIRKESEEDPSLKGALRAPTYKQVNQYLDYLLELASISFADQVNVEINKGTIDKIDQKAKAGPTVKFDDGTALVTKGIIIANPPPHMGASKSPALNDDDRPHAAAAGSSKPRAKATAHARSH